MTTKRGRRLQAKRRGDPLVVCLAGVGEAELRADPAVAIGLAIRTSSASSSRRRISTAEPDASSRRARPSSRSSTGNVADPLYPDDRRPSESSLAELEGGAARHRRPRPCAAGRASHRSPGRSGRCDRGRQRALVEPVRAGPVVPEARLWPLDQGRVTPLGDRTGCLRWRAPAPAPPRPGRGRLSPPTAADASRCRRWSVLLAG